MNSSFIKISFSIVVAVALMARAVTSFAGAPGPVVIKWVKERELPHDPTAFTQGLEVWDKRYFLETTGQYGQSEIRRVEMATGKVVSRQALESKYFGEGVVTSGKDIFQLTWREGVILRWGWTEKSGFKQSETKPWSGEGWGMTSGRGSFWVSNGTSEIVEVDMKSLKVKRTVKVTLSGNPMDRLNELEFVNGKIFANVWMTSTIVRIDPKSGNIDGLMDISSLVPKGLSPDAVANGIAWDAAKKRLYVTGKLWPTVYEVSFK